MILVDTSVWIEVLRDASKRSALERALAEPFHSRWAFDVELLARLTRGPDALLPSTIREEPLCTWRDVPGSKLRARHMAQAAIDLAQIAWRVRHPQ